MMDKVDQWKVWSPLCLKKNFFFLLLFFYTLHFITMAVLSLLRDTWDPVAARLEKWVRRVAADLPVDTDWSQSTKGSW